MKKIIPLALLGCFALTANAQLETGFNYALSIPQKQMNENINLTHSGVMDFRYHFKGALRSFWAGTQFGLGTYAMKTQKETFVFGNGETTEANVRFSSNVFNSHAIIGADLLRGRNFTPYLMTKAGVSKYYTRVYIPDPNDQGSCKPLENKNVYKDAAWSGGLGAGVKIDAKQFVNTLHHNEIWFDFSVSYLAGGELNYLNAKHVMDDNGGSTPTKSYNVTFVHVTTNEIHQHKVAEVFTSRIDQVEIKLGLFFKMD